MSFAAKQDFFGIAGGGIVCTESNENKTASVAEATNERGDVIAFTSFGEHYEPTCSYLLSADAQLSAIECGKPIAGGTGYSGKKFTCSSITINTAAGSAPTIQASGTEIPAATTHSDCKYQFPAATLKVCHHAQILWNAFTLAG